MQWPDRCDTPPSGETQEGEFLGYWTDEAWSHSLTLLRLKSLNHDKHEEKEEK